MHLLHSSLQTSSVYSLCVGETCLSSLFVSAVQAVAAMGLLAKDPMTKEDRLLVSENAASNLLSLAAQIALEVDFIITELISIYLRWWC